MSPRDAPVGVVADGRVLTCGGFGQDARWQEGERLETVFEQHCDSVGDRLAVEADDLRLTFAELDAWANRLARHLRALGVRPGDRVGLLFDRPADAYAGMLAVLKAGAAYVPLDTAFPDDRLAYIVQDADVRRVLSVSSLRARLPVDVVCLDEDEPVIARQPAHRLTPQEKGEPADGLCYVVYTSGSTGRPKGVTVEHSAICNFVRVAVEVYGIEPGDRMYQGMTIAFDFSVEEIWVPLLSGATLVPRPAGASLLGHELRDFLVDKGITALCCVPTLLATIDDDVPDLRFLLVSGEACPEDLVNRWYRPDRRFLNVYGPTEATVTATWAVVRPDRPVTIGVPLPTYSVVVLDPDEPRALDRGETGELGIAGIGLATGYLNRPELTTRAFVPDFLGIEHNPSGRIYRTGDLARIDEAGEIEYLGRIDTQVKIRGYRVEVTEIESVLLRVPDVAQAVVEPYRPDSGTVELVAYYSLRQDAADPGAEEIYRQLRERLPAYMVPAYLERLDLVPMTPAGKADRRNLPAPTTTRSLASGRAHVEPTNETERVLAEALAEAVRVERVSVDSDFFAELGADSLLLARFCAKVRQRTDLPPIPMRDVYRHTTVRSLAASLSGAPVGTTRVEPTRRAGTARYLLCGLAQLLIFLGYACGFALLLETGFEWIAEAQGIVDLYLRSVEMAVAAFAFVSGLPIVAKWVLIGRWRPREIPLWGLTYLRFWTVKALIRFSPLSLFVGSPLYVLYLRALGARIGKGVLFMTRTPPVCTDLLTVGDGAVIRKDSYLNGYRVRAGVVQTGRVTLGRQSFVGEMSVLDIDVAIGDNAQLGHASSLHSGQTVPDGESWHGSPAQKSTVDYRAIGTSPLPRGRRALFGLAQLFTLLVVSMPLVLLATDLVIGMVYTGPPDFTSWAFYRGQLLDSALLYFGGLVVGLLIVLTVPRLLTPLLRPGRTYPLYGLRFAVHQTLFRLTNVRAFNYLFGDSSAIVYYLRALGYRLGAFEQTGSNFGVEVKHESPTLSTVGVGTMVSDGLSILNADFSGTSFRVREVAVAPRTFLGNSIAYPPGAHVGENCLLATKVLVPLDGPVRSDTGLLGSPAFEIPRTVRRDTELDIVEAKERGLPAKNRHNTATALIYLFVHWFQVLGIVLIGVATGSLHARLDWLATAANIVLTVVFTVLSMVLTERAAQGFRRLRPRFCSIYDPVFWRHERFWKLSPGRYLMLFDGTPLKNVLWRLLGVRIGRRVLDDGCAIPEKSLVTLGDDCSLNAGTVIQGHSLEDGTFKSDHITVGAGTTLGTGAFVHYGSTIGEHAVVEPDSFVMKGTEAPTRSRWRGNPAVELTENSAEDPARRQP
ncbi:non-ribosomal peptide synthetase-like protein [Saccharothrix tamanrassetensis]|uniref:Non-ribosomal peptide synthetase-like protein n=1 Tax=Saccharothrix tamanrassetensis TaxID=1051531 RepID=A0A841CSY2_9PSEU|nr:Pls/PosA family non-ribosomal peptide synthetase [Saccharothrix tamanrassetensis]MBB5960380.1 non-ribosomal peptide synthetase-like protein [Saccharothrix tamanrassetensis]